MAMLSTSEVITLLQIVTHIPGDRNRRGLPTLFEGDVSRAKTALIEQFAQRSSINLTKFLLSQINADELVGIPSRGRLDMEKRTAEVLAYVPQKWAMKAYYDLNPTIVFFDEFNMGAKDVLDAAQTFLTHGTLGDLQLPSHVTILGAQNPCDMVGGTPLSPAMASRWLHVKWEPIPTSEWVTYLQGLPLWYDVPHRGEASAPLMPTQEIQEMLHLRWPSAFTRSLGFISAYLQANQAERHKLPPVGDPQRQKGFPCERQWVSVARVIAGCEVLRVNTPGNLLRVLVEGCIGEASTRLFLTWLSSLNLPAPQEVISGAWLPDPRRHDIAYLVQQNLLLWADDLTPELRNDTIRDLWLFVEKLYDAKLPDLGHLYLQGIQNRGWFIRDQKLLQRITALAGMKAMAAEEIGAKAPNLPSNIGRKI